MNEITLVASIDSCINTLGEENAMVAFPSTTQEQKLTTSDHNMHA